MGQMVCKMKMNSNEIWNGQKLCLRYLYFTIFSLNVLRHETNIIRNC